jgi:hypothetical protein
MSFSLGVRLASLWVMPSLLLPVASQLLDAGRDGLWLAFLFVLAPLFGLLAAVPHGRRLEAGAGTLPLLALLLVVGLVVWANLSLAGDMAARLGLPRWRGSLPVAAAALGLVLWPRASRPCLWLIPVGLFALLLPLVVIALGSGLGPIAAWSQVASQPAFRFPAGSPWVTEGRPVRLRGGSPPLLFEEEHRVTAVDAGLLGVEVSDRGRLRVQEWTPAPGQSVTLRPGDRLQVDSTIRLKFEAGKRVPGAPVSGIAWADSSLSPRPLVLIRLGGLGLTLLGGAVALLSFAGPTGLGRSAAGLGGLVLLAALGWAEGWAIYAARLAPEFFLGGVSATAMPELPGLALRGAPWGAGLTGLMLVGLVALFLAGSVGLRERLAAGDRETDRALTTDRGLWSGIFVTTALASLWPVEPWSLVLTALGLGASTLAPLILAGERAPGRAATAWAVGVGLVLFLGLSAAGRLGVPPGLMAQAIVGYPALVAVPVTAGILWVAGRPPRP